MNTQESETMQKVIDEVVASIKSDTVPHCGVSDEEMASLNVDEFAIAPFTVPSLTTAACTVTTSTCTVVNPPTNDAIINKSTVNEFAITPSTVSNLTTAICTVTTSTCTVVNPTAIDVIATVPTTKSATLNDGKWLPTLEYRSLDRCAKKQLRQSRKHQTRPTTSHQTRPVTSSRHTKLTSTFRRDTPLLWQVLRGHGSTSPTQRTKSTLQQQMSGAISRRRRAVASVKDECVAIGEESSIINVSSDDPSSLTPLSKMNISPHSPSPSLFSPIPATLPSPNVLILSNKIVQKPSSSVISSPFTPFPLGQSRQVTPPPQITPQLLLPPLTPPSQTFTPSFTSTPTTSSMTDHFRKFSEALLMHPTQGLQSSVASVLTKTSEDLNNIITNIDEHYLSHFRNFLNFNHLFDSNNYILENITTLENYRKQLQLIVQQIDRLTDDIKLRQ